MMIENALYFIIQLSNKITAMAGKYIASRNIINGMAYLYNRT